MKIDLIIDNKDKDDVKFTTLEPVSFTFKGKIHIIPSGFFSDGASVPRIFWPIVSPNIHPSTIIESIVHDYMFRKKMGFLASNFWYFSKLLKNVGFIRALIAFLGITIFGWIVYIKKKTALQR